MNRRDSQKTLKQKLKVVFLGDKGVGKSSIIGKFSQNKFEENCPATIGVDFVTKLCKYNKSKYKLELWDTAGQEKYRSLIKGYLRGANACIFVYDRSNPKTYLNLIDWIKTFEQVSNDENTFVMIFGNKTDLLQQNSQFEKIRMQAIKLFPRIKEIVELEGSAKLGENIQQIFYEILENFEESSPIVKFASSKTIGSCLVKTFKQNAKANKTIRCCDV